MPLSRRGSGSIALPGGQHLAMHTRTQDEEPLPHATKSHIKGLWPTISDDLKACERCTTETTIAYIQSNQCLNLVQRDVGCRSGNARAGCGAYNPRCVSPDPKAHPNPYVFGSPSTDTGLQPMIPTFVFGWPSGDESGDYLAIDLGGTNLRVCLVTLQGKGKFEVTQSKYRLSEEQKQDDGQKLFDFCAESLKTFINTNSGEGGLIQLAPGEKLPLGFTFSYPCKQDRIDHGVLIRWTKGFGAPNTEGKDVAGMFQKSLDKFELPVILSALINDTTGTLIASHYVNPTTRIACIFGTGCNAAYMEHIKDIPKIKDLGLPDKADMAINCEWGAFDSFEHEHLPRSKYDVIIDEASNKPGEQAFEKLISGRYLGEIMRLVICELIDDGILFLGQNTYKVEVPNALDTALLSLMESDPTDELLMIIGIMSHFFALETTLAERQFLRAIARLIGRRAARLSACGIGALVGKMGYLEDGCAVGCDGSLYNKYPGFAGRIHEGLIDIFGERAMNIRTHHAEDGSGVGSAIIAAMTKARKDAGLYVNL